MSFSTATTIEDFQENLRAVREKMDKAAERVGRDSSEVRLLPVSKTVPEERIRLAIAAGAHQLGENKVQEAKRKHANLIDEDVKWSIIGHLQTNKAKDVAAFASEFHALDSLRVAEALDRRLELVGRSLDVYVQVNTSGEESKYGLEPEVVPDMLNAFKGFESLNVKGLMTLAIFSDDKEAVRTCFQLLKRLRDEARDRDPDLIGPGELSMGMSGDYEIAIEEGANIVRVGQAIFGARSTTDAYYWPGGTTK
ncbi:YggS family pyridoxal phosphate-dependent enzyme [Flaviflexus massiliensis]|uniref:YggS family pyridoxal phosphate-dependent enzyme n=1 Tax=Flaviflexus massiliensis TaxID=1522309 RepID=UPI0006D5673E|nr:YggS family pyridoxal phosphate-dependent enzyme [Flaviflexus massiliensis]